MKVHTRSLLIIGMTVFIVFLAMVFIALVLVLPYYTQLEEKESFINLEHVKDQIEFGKENLGDIARDWAVGDDIYGFMADRDPGYIKNDMDSYSVYKDLHVDGALYYDIAGNYFDGRWFNQRNTTLEEVPPVLQDYFFRHAVLLNSLSSNTTTTGFILLPDGPSLIAMHQILPGSGNGPPRGTLVILRRYDDEQVTNLRDRAFIPVNLIPINENLLKNDPVVLQLTGTNVPDHFSRIYNSSAIMSSTIIPDLNGKPALLLEVTTQRSIYEQALSTVLLRLVAFLIIAVFSVVFIGLLMRKYIVTPLTDLDSRLKEIGQKRNLSERLPVSGDDEIASLKRSLNAMLAELEETQVKLAEANRKANLYLEIYLDVLTYEIRNALFSLRGFTSVLNKTIGENEKRYTLRMAGIIEKSDAIIRNIEIISKIYKHPPEQKPVNLGEVVTKEIHANPGVTIHTRNCNIMVLADEMLPVVFRNLLSNSIKFGGTGVEIEINTDDQPDGMVLVSLTDTGTGISDETKPIIFDRFMQDSDKRSSYGLGLYIAKMLVEAYGGRIWADDRVKGHPKSGAAIRFTLKKG